MICQYCKKNEATIHFTQIVDGAIKKINLCDECAKKLGLSKDLAFPLMETLQNMHQEARQKNGGDGQTCPYCGYTLQDIEKKGRIGCPECYNAFSDKMEAIFRDVQRGEKHIGKTIKISSKKKRKTAVAKAHSEGHSDVVKIAKYSMDLSGPDAETKNKADSNKAKSAKGIGSVKKGKNKVPVKPDDESALGALIVLACTLASDVERSGNSAIDCEHLIIAVNGGVEEYLNNPNKQFPNLKNLQKVESDIPASLVRFGMDVMALVVAICMHNHALIKAIMEEDYETAAEIRNQIEEKKQIIISILEKTNKK